MRFYDIYTYRELLIHQSLYIVFSHLKTSNLQTKVSSWSTLDSSFCSNQSFHTCPIPRYHFVNLLDRATSKATYHNQSFVSQEYCPTRLGSWESTTILAVLTSTTPVAQIICKFYNYESSISLRLQALNIDAKTSRKIGAHKRSILLAHARIGYNHITSELLCFHRTFCNNLEIKS